MEPLQLIENFLISVMYDFFTLLFGQRHRFKSFYNVNSSVRIFTVIDHYIRPKNGNTDNIYYLVQHKKINFRMGINELSINSAQL